MGILKKKVKKDSLVLWFAKELCKAKKKIEQEKQEKKMYIKCISDMNLNKWDTITGYCVNGKFFITKYPYSTLPFMGVANRNIKTGETVIYDYENQIEKDISREQVYHNKKFEILTKGRYANEED